MWELQNKLSRGRISLRRFSLVASTILLACFATLGPLTNTAFAEDAIRKSDDVITYQGKDYNHIDINTDGKLDYIPANLPQGTDGYINFTDDSNGPANLLLTQGSYKDATTAQSVSYEYKKWNKFGNILSGPTDVTITKAPDQKEGLIDSCDGAATGAIGWIICPVTTFLAKGMDTIYGIIRNFLVVTTISNDTDLSVYKLWAMVRDIANICFVIAFLIVVYSQITNIGLSNYSLKKMLPRLIIAAILVNTSYIISAAAVDISNILGSSIHNLFVGVMNKLNTGAQYNNTTGSPGITWSTMSAVILSGGAGAAALGLSILEAGGAIYFFLPFLVGTILAALVALIILAARQALIVCLIIISPLAFVAYVLPNTEKYFDKWKDGFLTLLLLFPIFSVVFSGAQLAGLAIIQNAKGNAITIILGMAVQVAPIVVTPLLVKFSGGIIGKIAGIVNNPNKGLIDRTRNWSRNAGQEHKNKVYSGQTWAGKKFGANGTYRGPGKKLARGAYRANTKPTRAYENYRRAVDARRKVHEDDANNAFAETESGQKLESMRRKNTNKKQEIDNTFAASHYGRQLELQSRHLGVQKQEIENSMLDTDEGRALTYRQRYADVNKTRVDNNFNESDYGKVIDTEQRTTDRHKQRITADHEAAWNTAIQTNPALKQVELGAKASEVKAALVKGQVDKMHSEIVAQGEESEHVIHLRGADATTQEHVLNLAKSIKSDSFDSQLTSMAKGKADEKIKQQLAENLSKTAAGEINLTFQGTDTPIHVYAGGIMGDTGVKSIVAKAKSEYSSVVIDNIKNAKNTLDYSESTDTNILLNKFTDSSATMEDRVAYAWTMTERGGPGNVALRKAIAHMDNLYAHDPENEDLQGFKELLASMSGAMKSGKDIEFWLTNSRDKTGRIKNFQEISNDTGTWNALQVESFTGMNMISQFKALRTFARSNKPELYRKLVADIKSNPQSYAQLKPAVKEALEHTPEDATYWSDAEIAQRAGIPPSEFDINSPW